MQLLPDEKLLPATTDSSHHSIPLHASRIDLPHNPQLRGSEADIGDFFMDISFFLVSAITLGQQVFRGIGAF